MGWTVTVSEEFHYDYDDQDVALARRVIDAVPGRWDEVLSHLRDINAELHRLILASRQPER